MVVGASEMSGEDEGETAGGAGGGESTDFATASAAEVSAARGPGMTCAEAFGGFDDAGGEAHH